MKRALLLASTVALLVGCATSAPPASTEPMQMKEADVMRLFQELNIHAPIDHLVICVMSPTPCQLWTEEELTQAASKAARQGYEFRKAEEAAERKGKSL